MQKLITLGSLVFLLMLAALSGPSVASSHAQQQTQLQYAAKFVCGKTDAGLVAAGQYFTIINVHNPSPNTGVRFRKKFALGERSEKVGKIYGFFPASLRADEVMGIDCPDIYKHTGIPPGTFIEGYAVIQTPRELDVVSVFTAGGDHVETLHTERVPLRRVPVVTGCANFDMSVNTGTAPWRITADPLTSTSEPRAASIITPANTGWSSLAGGQWIGPATNAGSTGTPGDYVYELSFCLCQGFSNAKLSLKGLADNSAKVYLNGNLLAPTIPGFSGGGTVVSTTSFFGSGTNILRIVVRNNEFATGLNVTGSIVATAGRCSGVTTDETNSEQNPD